MCLDRYQKPCCVLLGITAITFGVVEISYNSYLLVQFEINYWLIASVAAWSLIVIAAILLIVGSLKRMPLLLLIWIIVGLGCGISLIIIRTRLLISSHLRKGVNADILRAMINIFFLLLVFIWSYYPYAYMRDIKLERFAHISNA
ncbi:uncharacterized protein LOC108144970 [Drosophila elegans]|uniref:uncharacterized protein LOC108144970 n=1 Tax=Drosophila elegans TaxID=30023 RepID=UPI0007E6382F|nr:uncharacterized protein LOC108144970 [Drosophila elegans]